MQKVIKLTVLSAVSIATVLAPLDTTLADIQLHYREDITKRMNDMKREMERKMENMKKGMSTHFPSHNFEPHTSFEKHHQHIYSSKKHPHDYVEHRRREQSHYHIEHKTHHSFTREKTTHRHIHKYITHNNTGEALTAGILALAAGVLLNNIFKRPKQPQIVYQAVPQNGFVYQQVPQKKVIYENQTKTTYQPLHEPWTHNWLQYCKKRYRSFNPKTGTFKGYDGLEHFCHAPLN